MSKATPKTKHTALAIHAPVVEHPKYAIASMLRNMYGEFNYDKQGVDDLATFCGLQKKQTVKEWMSVRAGSSKKINHLVLGKVLTFFSIQSENQLFTAQHKSLLKGKAVAPNNKVVA